MRLTHAMPPASRRDRAPRLLLHGALLCVALHHAAVVLSQYRANALYTHDVGSVAYMLLHTLHGRFFHSIVHDAPHFAVHVTATHVLLLPLFAIFRSVLFEPLLASLVLFSSGWAVALVATRLLGLRRSLAAAPPLALCAGLLAVAHPLVGSVALANHFEALAVGLGAWALAALVCGRTRTFWALFVLTLGVKEDLGLYWGCFGLWWALWGAGEKRARRRLGAAAALVAFGWSGGAFLMLHGVREASGYVPPLAGRYAHLGGGPLEAAAFLARNAWPLARIGFAYAALLLSGALFLPLLRPRTLLLLAPPAVVMGLSNFGPQRELLYYYSYPFLPFLFYGLAAGLARLAGWMRRPASRRRILRPALGAALFLAAAGFLLAPTRTDGRRRLPLKPGMRHAWIRETLREIVPPDASVAAQYDLLCQLPMRIGMQPLGEERLDRTRWWVLDLHGVKGDVSPAEYDRILRRIAADREAGRARVVLQRAGLLVVERLE